MIENGKPVLISKLRNSSSIKSDLSEETTNVETIQTTLKCHTTKWFNPTTS